MLLACVVVDSADHCFVHFDLHRTMHWDLLVDTSDWSQRRVDLGKTDKTNQVMKLRACVTCFGSAQ